MKRNLNDRFLKSLVAPSEEVGRIEYSDTKRPGLRFRLSYTGRASWVYEKRVKGGAKRKHTFGAWPEPISLATARAMALEIEAEAVRGIDRVAIAKADKLTAEIANAKRLRVCDVIEIYDKLHLSNLRRGAERKHQLRQSFCCLQEKPIGSLTKSDLQKPIDEKLAAGRRVFANRIRSALMAFTRWAWERGHLDTDIGASLPKAVKETERERVPSIAEIRLIWQATFAMGDIWGPFLRLLILTAQRRGEVLGLAWSEIDFPGARIVKPGSQTKNGKEHITHLSEPAFNELVSLKSLLEVAGQPASGLIFTTTGRTPISGVSKAKARLDKLLVDDVEPWRLHDIRTSFSTAMAEAGVPESVADRVLNHSAVGSAPSAVARVYNRAELLPQRASALDRWASMITQKASIVVALGGRQ
ncbi:tyrosine-type recombinase/integrase [Loktanella sp. Alg231-35]|uniref:tyrosine-type recombinase/integrase n=1 Tax=Loktanella sp. Alg231-35 TaxID=1922220 RepID=UPI000D54F6D3|nr:site-specific integrase [Loktanella sp. Alg231-35]